MVLEIMDIENTFGFHCDTHNVSGFKLSYLDSERGDIPLHFYHANGFPVSVYVPLLKKLKKDFRVLGMGHRGQDDQAKGNISWHHAADDLIDFLDKKDLGPIIGVGHSIGAVGTMFAAARRPELFSGIVLIDPVLLPRRYIVGMTLMRFIGRKDLFFLAKRARKRRKGWKDHAEAYEYFKTKNLFRYFQDDFLRSYVTYGLKPSKNGGVELLCPPEAEARIFENYPLDIWSWPGKVKVPTLIIRGAHSEVLSEFIMRRFCRICKKALPEAVENAGHLIPMEQPDRIIELIKTFSKRQ